MNRAKELMREYGIIARTAKYAHKQVNQKYDGLPYDYHTNMVYCYAVKYRKLIIFECTDEEFANVLASAWAHDLIEDARQTYNDVRNNTNKGVADIAYALTNDKGKNRSERAGDNYYKGIRAEKFADYIKICDRLANLKHSSMMQSRMLDVYRNENDHFRAKLYQPKYDEMFQEMEELMAVLSPEEAYYQIKRNRSWLFFYRCFPLIKIITIISLFLMIISYIIK